MTSVTDGVIEGLPESRLFEFIWQETSALRRDAHDGARCPTRTAPYGEQDPHAARLDSACKATDCLDYVHEIYLGVLPRLTARLATLRRSGELRHVERFAHKAVKSEVKDMGRRWRSGRGLAAKPERLDGVPGRVAAALTERAGDAKANSWYATLFRMMLCYANKRGVPGRNWPLDGWTQEKSSVDAGSRVVGSSAARREIRVDIERVTAVAIEVAGRDWVYKNVTSALAISSAPYSLDEFDDNTPGQPTATPPDEEAIAGLARREFAEQCWRGVSRTEAIRAMLTKIFDVPPKEITEDAIRRAADTFDLDALSEPESSLTTSAL